MQKKRIKRYFKKILTAVRARFETDSLMLAVEQIASFFCSPPVYPGALRLFKQLPADRHHVVLHVLM